MRRGRLLALSLMTLVGAVVAALDRLLEKRDGLAGESCRLSSRCVRAIL